MTNQRTTGCTESVRPVFDALVSAWAAGNSDEYAALFTEDAVYVAYDGSQMAGRRAIADGHRDLFAGIMRGSRMLFETPTTRFVRPDIALVTVVGGIVMRWQRASAPSKSRRSTLSFVLVRQHDQWLVSSFQNTRYRPWNRTLFGRLAALATRATSR